MEPSKIKTKQNSNMFFYAHIGAIRGLYITAVLLIIILCAHTSKFYRYPLSCPYTGKNVILFIVCSQTLCAVLSHCFTDFMCVQESMFFVLKVVGHTTNYRTIILTTNSVKICIILLLT